jgi:ribosomal protein S18 acetylase RimI-like enzyme
MSENYLTFEVKVKEFNLPAQKEVDNLTINKVKTKYEYNDLLDLFNQIFPDEIDTEKEGELRSQKNSEYKGTYVAKINDTIVGFLMTGILDFTDPVAYILYLGVSDEYRSKAIATNMLYRFKNDLIEKEIPKIQARISKNNKLVLSYIKFLGFRKIK